MENTLKNTFKLSDEELSNPKLRKGYPGNLIYPEKANQNSLSGYYRAGKYVGCRGDIMKTLNSTLPPRKLKKNEDS